MNKDRFYKEMEIAYKKNNNGGNINSKQCKDFMVDVGTSFYQVDCKKYIENMNRFNINRGVNNSENNKDGIE